MVDKGGLDAIWFVMPPNQHKGEIEYAAEHGIHIFAEKPQSLFLDEILHQNEAIKKAGVTSMAGFQMRHDRGYTDIRNYLKDTRSEEHTSELQSLMRISYAVFCLKKKKT